MSIEKQLAHAVDKDAMHRAVDAIPQGGCAILIANAIFENCPAPDTYDYWMLGEPSVNRMIGMLETTKLFIFTEAETECDDPDEEC